MIFDDYLFIAGVDRFLKRATSGLRPYGSRPSGLQPSSGLQSSATGLTSSSLQPRAPAGYTGQGTPSYQAAQQRQYGSRPSASRLYSYDTSPLGYAPPAQTTSGTNEAPNFNTPNFNRMVSGAQTEQFKRMGFSPEAIARYEANAQWARNDAGVLPEYRYQPQLQSGQQRYGQPGTGGATLAPATTARRVQPISSERTQGGGMTNDDVARYRQMAAAKGFSGAPDTPEMKAQYGASGLPANPQARVADTVQYDSGGNRISSMGPEYAAAEQARTRSLERTGHRLSGAAPAAYPQASRVSGASRSPVNPQAPVTTATAGSGSANALQRFAEAEKRLSDTQAGLRGKPITSLAETGGKMPAPIATAPPVMGSSIANTPTPVDTGYKFDFAPAVPALPPQPYASSFAPTTPPVAPQPYASSFTPTTPSDLGANPTSTPYTYEDNGDADALAKRLIEGQKRYPGSTSSSDRPFAIGRPFVSPTLSPG